MATAWSDTFTDDNDTSIDEHTPNTGAGYTLDTGAATIQSNKLQLDDFEVHISFEAGQTSFTGSVAITLTDTGMEQFLWGLRWQDVDNQVTVVVDVGGGEIRLESYSSGTPTEHDSDVISLTPESTYTLSVQVAGNAIQATIDSVTVSATISAFSGETTQNIGGANAGGSTWDDLLVEYTPVAGGDIPIFMYHYRNHW